MFSQEPQKYFWTVTYDTAGTIHAYKFDSTGVVAHTSSLMPGTIDTFHSSLLTGSQFTKALRSNNRHHHLYQIDLTISQAHLNIYRFDPATGKATFLQELVDIRTNDSSIHYLEVPYDAVFDYKNNKLYVANGYSVYRDGNRVPAQHSIDVYDLREGKYYFEARFKMPRSLGESPLYPRLAYCYNGNIAFNASDHYVSLRYNKDKLEILKTTHHPLRAFFMLSPTTSTALTTWS